MNPLRSTVAGHPERSRRPLAAWIAMNLHPLSVFLAAALVACTSPPPVPDVAGPMPTTAPSTPTGAAPPSTSTSTSTPVAERPARPGSEAIIWYTPKAPGLVESAWIKETPDGYEVLATRPEPVMAWRDGEPRALRSIPRPQACGEVELPLPRLAATTLFASDEASLLGPVEAPAGVLHYEDPTELLGSIDGAVAYRAPSFQKVGAQWRASDALNWKLLSARAAMPAVALWDAALQKLRAELAGGPPDPGETYGEHGPKVPTRAVVAALRARAGAGPLGYSVLDFGEVSDAAVRRRDEALQLFQQARVPAAPEPQLARLLSACRLANRGELAPALAAFDALIVAAPELVAAVLGRGDARRRSGDLAGARADLEAVAAKPDPAMQSRAQLALGALDEGAGERAAAIAHYQAAASLDERSPAPDKLAALGATAVAYFPGAAVPVVVSGLPAISADGALIASVLQQGHGMSEYSTYYLEVHRARGGARVFTQEIYGDSDRNVSEPDEEKALLARYERASKRIDAQLGGHAWHPLVELARSEDDFEARAMDYTSADHSLTVRYRHPELSIDLAGAPGLLVKSLPLRNVNHQDGLDCSSVGFLEDASTDPAKTVVVLHFAYEDGNTSDMCGFPKPVSRVFPIPSATSHAGWRETPRPAHEDHPE